MILCVCNVNVWKEHAMGNWPLDGCNSFDSNGAFSIAITKVCPLSAFHSALKHWPGPKSAPPTMPYWFIALWMYIMYIMYAYVCSVTQICRCRAPPILYTHRKLAATKKAINFDSVNNNSFFFLLYLQHWNLCIYTFNAIYLFSTQVPDEIIQT